MAAAAELVEVVACRIAAAGTLAVAECLISAAIVDVLELTAQVGYLDAGLVDLHSIVAAASHEQGSAEEPLEEVPELGRRSLHASDSQVIQG